MKKGLKGIRTALGICAAAGWWGFLYPQLALTPDTVVLKLSDDGGICRSQAAEWEFDGELYHKLLNAGPENISFRSRLFTDLNGLLEALDHGNK